ncbi:hypothetical protein PINS_up003857 [Pythium insidiosum]|nr:hypothetical protein PINS_up003857 [Pythium insidiosum]
MAFMNAHMPLANMMALRCCRANASARSVRSIAGVPGLEATSALHARFFSAPPPPSRTAVPLDQRRILETSIVEGAESKVMRWVGRGSATQMYCALIFAGKLVYEADASANIYEVWATSGAIASASACVFFGAKLMCDKIVTDIASCRNFGEKNEFVKLTIQGALAKYALCVSTEDLRLTAQSKPDVYNFQVGDRNFSVDVSKGKCTNRKALETLLQGKPLVTRKGKHPKQKRA